MLRTISTHGSLNIADITREVELPYPTVCRIVNSLVQEGYVEREPSRKLYRVTGLVESLSQGFQRDNLLVQVSREHLVRLTHEYEWVAVLAAKLGSAMVVRDSTHVLTSLTFEHYFPGFTFPIYDSAAGRAYLAFASDEERERCFRGIELLKGNEVKHTLDLLRNGDDLDQIRSAGYATRERNLFTSPPGKNSSIAVPIFDSDGVCATLGIVFFAAAMSMEEAIERYVPPLVDAAQAVGKELQAAQEAADT